MRHHPALALWCGGNEFSARRNKPLVETLTETLAKTGVAGDISFSPTSPTTGDSHNWHVWHGGLSFAAYQAESAPMMSEFGLQALPDEETLAAMLSPNQAWEAHNGDSVKLMRYLRPFLKRDYLSGFSSNASSALPSNLSLSDLIVASQRAQAVALQTGIEHMRRRKAQAGGVILWQFNEPWPAISWAILDYYRRPKLAYQRLKWWYHPLAICLDFQPGQAWQVGQHFTATIWGINDTLTRVNGTLQVVLDGVVIFVASAISLPPDTAKPLGQIEHPLTHKPSQLSLTLQSNETTLARNHYDLDWHDHTTPSLFHRFRRWVADWVLR